METILVHNQCLRLGAAEEDYQFNIPDKNRDIVEKYTTAREVQNLSIPITEKLREFLKLNGVQTTLAVGESFNDIAINIGFRLRNPQDNNNSRAAYFDLFPANYFRDVVLGAEFLKKNVVIMKLEIERLQNDVTGMTLNPQVKSHEFTLCVEYPGTEFDGRVVFDIEPREGMRNVSVDSEWPDSESHWMLTFSLSLIIQRKDGPDLRVPDHLAFTRRMLQEPVHYDVTIIPGTGSPVGCHRAVLAAHSPVFKAMFGKDTLEGQTGRVEVPGMTEEGIRAMLEYLYGWTTVAAQNKPIVSVELLEVSDKYNLQELEKAMENLFLTSEDGWCTPEASLRLVLFLKDKDTSALKTRALEIFRRNFNGIQKLPAYTELFNEGPNVLMSFVNYVASD